MLVSLQPLNTFRMLTSPYQFYFGARYFLLASVICDLFLFGTMSEINCSVRRRDCANTHCPRGLPVDI